MDTYSHVLPGMQEESAASNPEQRLMRYQRSEVQAPTRFEFHTSDDETVDLATILASSDSAVDGFFVGVVDSLVPVSDPIDPHGPIGYHVNYAVYKVRDSYTVYALPRRVSR